MSMDGNVLEPGVGFALVGSQYRLRVADDEFYLDYVEYKSIKPRYYLVKVYAASTHWGSREWGKRAWNKMHPRR
ncbi:hypothetical protein NKDENANG_00373 [Candidatus Entotheonellaceae bacterium PAL068K]